MERRLYILILLSFLLSGCYGYVGGLDDSNFKFTELVFINRSQHEIELRFPSSKWSEGPDTIRLEKGNGLWKKDFEFDYSYSNDFYDEVEMVVDGKEKFYFDDYSLSIPYNPCTTQYMHNLNDNKGLYYVYEFNETAYKVCKSYLDQLRIFKMTDVPPSYIAKDTLITDGSTEALFNDFYPVASLRGHISLGAVIGKEAESLDRITVYPEYGVAPGNIERIDKDYISGRQDKPCGEYYDIDQLRKTGLAHFGCDFAELTGRDKMEKFCGCLYSTAHIKYREQLLDTKETTDFASFINLDKGIISYIGYGNLKILLAEADCYSGRLSNYLRSEYLTDYGSTSDHIEDIDFYLIDLDENGEFRCRKGGPEIIDLFLTPSAEEPSFPVFAAIRNYEGVHIQNISL